MSLEERVARIEGILEQMDKRLNHLESDVGSLREELRSEASSLRADLRSEAGSLRAELARKVDKWEVRIWFLILLAFISLWSWIILQRG